MGGGVHSLTQAGRQAGKPHKAASAADAGDHLARAGGRAACLLPFYKHTAFCEGWLLATWVRGVGERRRKEVPGVWGPFKQTSHPSGLWSTATISALSPWSPLCPRREQWLSGQS